MKRNPLIPFAFIAVVGIILMLSFSFIGLDNMKDAANGGEEKKAAANPEEIVQQTCTSCHGQNLEGAGQAPALKDVGARLSKDQIQDVIINGKGTGMPGGLVPPDNAAKIAEWLSKKK